MSLEAQLVAFVNAVGALLIAFHVVLTQDQLAAVAVVVNGGYALGSGIYAALRKRKAAP